MLTVETYLAQSPTHGIGIFAAEDIARGEVVWVYNPVIDRTFSPDEWLGLERQVSPACFAMIARYTYKQDGQFVLCADNSQFMNHAEVANVGSLDNLDVMVALVDIARDEELLCDYREYSDPDDHHRLWLDRQPRRHGET